MSKDFSYCQKNKEKVKHFHGISLRKRKKKKVEVIGKNAVVLHSQTVGHKLLSYLHLATTLAPHPKHSPRCWPSHYSSIKSWYEIKYFKYFRMTPLINTPFLMANKTVLQVEPRLINLSEVGCSKKGAALAIPVGNNPNCWWTTFVQGPLAFGKHYLTKDKDKSFF